MTGGSGFIGGAVVERLRADGHKVDSFDARLGLDVRDPDACLVAFDGADVVVHLAGVLGTDELFDEVQHAVDVNVKGTVNVLEACARVGTRFVGITMPPVFPSIYTATKVAAQRLASAYHHSLGLEVCHVRAFNAYGPRQANGDGHPRKIVPAFACEAWSGRPLTIWGDGTQTVDLVHVDAIADVFAAAVHVGDDSVIDAGTGHALSVLDVAELVITATGSKSGVRHLPMRRGEIPTHIRADGEGWRHLERLGVRPPRWETARLLETVISYRDHPSAQAA